MRSREDPAGTIHSFVMASGCVVEENKDRDGGESKNSSVSSPMKAPSAGSSLDAGRREKKHR